MNHGPSVTLDLGFDRLDPDLLPCRFSRCRRNARCRFRFSVSLAISLDSAALAEGSSEASNAMRASEMPSQTCITHVSTGCGSDQNSTCLHLSNGAGARMVYMSPCTDACTRLEVKLKTFAKVSPSRKVLDAFVIELTRFDNAPAGSDQSRILDRSPASMSATSTDSRTYHSNTKMES